MGTLFRKGSMNKVYTVSIDMIPQAVINEVSKEVIGY